MPLENAQYIEDLILTNPDPEDFRSEGDDHFRAFKRAVKQTFPGMAGRSWRVQSRSESGPISLNDNMSVINAGVITLTPVSASVLGNGFMCFIRATAGNVVVNPAENINGAGQMTIPVGYTGILLCNGAEFFMLVVYQDVPTAAKAFPAGTKCVFHQTSAPTGWTKITSSQLNNAAIRLTTGSVATGGADDFTATFGVGKRTGDTTLTTGQIPSHTHFGGHPNTQGFDVNAPGIECFGVTSATSTGATGGGGSHDHALLNFNLKYADFIVASID